jgi:hypothetical protein
MLLFLVEQPRRKTSKRIHLKNVFLHAKLIDTII